MSITSSLRPFIKGATFSQQFKPKQVVSIVGGGQITHPTALEALRNPDNRVIIHTNRAGRLKAFCEEVDPAGDRIRLVQTTYEQGQSAKYWAEAFQKDCPQDTPLRVVNTRGVASLPQGKTYQDVIKNPSLALVEGLVDARGSNSPTTLINCSSSAASVPNFDHSYAQVRKETDESIEQIAKESNISGHNLRFDLVLSPTSKEEITSPNHGAAFHNLSRSLFQIVVEDGDVLALQPINQECAVQGILNPKAAEQGDFTTINAVGPKAYSQNELYQFYSNLLGKPVRIIQVPASAARWAAKHINFGQVSFGIQLLDHRSQNPSANQPLNHKPFEELIGKKLPTIEEIYQDPSYSDTVVQAQSPTMAIAKQAMSQLVNNSEARKDFVSQVVPEIPGLMLQGVRALAV
ncbi:MAG: hypothetical protein JSS32_09930 [Verrucomicrobia bacterium]|nr:hypothetical protein [Verrucomicrobiota bacterium]